MCIIIIGIAFNARQVIIQVKGLARGHHSEIVAVVVVCMYGFI